jgi:hypothetical protein
LSTPEITDGEPYTLVSDPIGSGFGVSLAHPGGNIAGFTTNEPAVGGKWIGLLKEIAPRTVRVARGAGILRGARQPRAN